MTASATNLTFYSGGAGDSPQDPSSIPPPSNWQGAATELSSLLRANGAVKASTAMIERECAAILALADGEDGGGGGESGGHVLSETVRAAVTTIYLRALIRGGKYSAVANFCKRRCSTENDAGLRSNADEEAYALYRLRDYEACLRLCDLSDGGHGGGLMHVRAQALYRLGETAKADAIYRQLLADDPPTTMDVDEREDTLANALANRVANYTPGFLLNGPCWLEEDDALLRLLASYGTTTPSSNNHDDSDEEGILHNYDLAYNFATYILVSSESRDQSQLLQARRLLEHAEISALTVLESSSTPQGYDDENHYDREVKLSREAAERKRQQQQTELAEREAGPIRANLTLVKLLLGGKENESEALRGYLTLITKTAKSKGGGGALEANLKATASNNLALLRYGKESLFDTIKRVPTTSYLSISEEKISDTSNKKGRKGGKEKVGGVVATAFPSATVSPLAGATPQQARVALFNRALLFAKMGNAMGCLATLDALRASLLATYHGDEGEKKGKGAVVLGAPKRSKGKKKKGAALAGSGGTPRDVPAARPASEAEAAVWNAYAGLIESELYRMSELSSKDNRKSPEEILDGTIGRLEEVSQGNNNNGTLAFAKSQLLLHKAAVNSSNQSPNEAARLYVETIESLPWSVQSCPGVVITLASLYASLNDDARAEELLLTLGDGVPARLSVAEFKMERGQYNDAVELLRGIAEEEGENLSLEAMALLVKALSHIDLSEAEMYVGLLQEAIMDEKWPGMDGEALESMEIPRFAKKAASGGEGGTFGGASSSKVRKAIEATGGRGRSNLGDRKKKNRESIIRKRASQREAYLSRLQDEGRYDPFRTPQHKPDPERWIPKSQRSYNRRRGGGGRHGGRPNAGGAQGGGAGAGMEKDAARLDVAARAAATKSGGRGPGDGKPSTANIKVSASGTTRKGKGKGGRRR